MAASATGLTSRIKLKDGNEMPVFGLGLFRTESGPGNSAETSVLHAVRTGYILIDTSEIHGVEADVGVALRKSGIPRSDVFIITKPLNNGYEYCKSSFAASLKKLDTDYVDLYMIHTPVGGKVIETYKAMLELQQAGLVKSVGVSNFGVHHLEPLMNYGLPVPAVNQIELHPWMRRSELVSYCREHDITVMGYSPLCKAQRFDDPTLQDIAKRLNRSPSSVLLRYSLQMGYITIPKSANTSRIEANTNVFNWDIPADDMALLNSLPESTCSWNPCWKPWEG